MAPSREQTTLQSLGQSFNPRACQKAEDWTLQSAGTPAPLGFLCGHQGALPPHDFAARDVPLVSRVLSSSGRNSKRDNSALL